VALVYCVRCGAKNPDDAAVCSQCGKPIMGVERGRMRHEKEMCFGMPSHWGSLLVGLFIVVLGLVLLYRQFVPGIADIFWPLVLVFLGIAVLLGGLYRYSRR
jgi:predicted nucleic acid-binding Zn ribbon protein